jgi:hypothetical protein
VRQSLGQLAGKNVLVSRQKHKLKREFVFQMDQASSHDRSSSRPVLDLLDGKKPLPKRIDLESRNDNCIPDTASRAIVINFDFIHLFIAGKHKASAWMAL